jgi:NADH-quinone oxidoreductase subunit C
VFRHAQTYEREIHEMYGVFFEGNARLTPLFLEHWRGPPPMRRDFDTRKYVEETFGSPPSAKE